MLSAWLPKLDRPGAAAAADDCAASRSLRMSSGGRRLEAMDHDGALLEAFLAAAMTSSLSPCLDSTPAPRLVPEAAAGSLLASGSRVIGRQRTRVDLGYDYNVEPPLGLPNVLAVPYLRLARPAMLFGSTCSMETARG